MKNLKIGVRLAIGFAVVVILMIGVAVVGSTRMSSINGETRVIVDQRFPNVLTLQAATDRSNEIARAIRNALLVGDAPTIDKELARVAENRKALTDLFDTLEKHLNTDKGRELLKRVRELRVPYGAAIDDVIRLVKDGKRQEAVSDLLVKVRPVQTAFLNGLAEFVKFQVELVEQGGRRAEDAYTMARNVMIVLTLAAMGVAAAIAWWVTRSVTVPIREAVDAAQAMSHGDLTVSIEARSSDETGQLLAALANTSAQLRGIVKSIKEATESIGTASQQIATGNTDLSQRTEEQASSLQETASSMEELTSTVRQTAQNAEQANQLATSASEVAARGGGVVSQVVQTMGAITESSQRIAAIIGVIDGIAFQTNILALNAAVEAARAGDQGRGFAVVASEVRSLAQKSAAAAKEIKQLITDSTGKVDEGAKLVDEAGRTMDEVVQSVRRVNENMAMISQASQQQSAGIEQVNTAVAQMDQVTQQNAALVEEAAAAAQSMHAQAERLAAAVAVFKVDRSAGTSGAA